MRRRRDVDSLFCFHLSLMKMGYITRYQPDDLLTPALKQDVAGCPDVVAPLALHELELEPWLGASTSDGSTLLIMTEYTSKMSTKEDDPSAGVNGRLRPRKSAGSENKARRRIRQPPDTSALQLLCPYCDKKFASKQNLSNHTRRVHIVTDIPLTCLYCDRSATDPNAIIEHMVSGHPELYAACLDCHTRFHSAADLEQHKLHVCEKQKQPYRSKLRQKKTSAKKTEEPPTEKSPISQENTFNGVVIACELKPTQIGDEADIEDNITTNLILPPNKNIVADRSTLEKNAVIVLDDLQWNKRIPANFSFHNTEADQILSRLGVVHRAPRTTETTKRDWLKTIDDATQKFERCFDTSFYSKVASNVQENLTKFLDGSFNFNPDPDSQIKTRKAKNNVVIHTAEGFPILLACEQFTRNAFEGYLPRAIAPKHKWKWDSVESDKSLMNPDQIKRDSHVNNCIITLVANLDMWTQLKMRSKFDHVFNDSPVEKKTEQQNIIGKQLKEILESREIPSTSKQPVKWVAGRGSEEAEPEFPALLGLRRAGPAQCTPASAELSGEWARPRCYVCMACGARAPDSRALAQHAHARHPAASVQHYEVVGAPLLHADILRHLYVPPGSAAAGRARRTRGVRDCTKCGSGVPLEELHAHMLECAGDAVPARRRPRPRPFGVRRRRVRHPDPATLRKRMRAAPRRKPLARRPRPRPRTEVGDAETIRKMLADLPAKRHRVLVNPLNLGPRPRKKLKEQQVKIGLKHRQIENRIKTKVRPLAPFSNSSTSNNMSTVKVDDLHKSNATNDDDDVPLKPRQKRLVIRSARQREVLRRKTAVEKQKRILRERVKARKITNQKESTNLQPQIEQVSIDNTSPPRISPNGSPYNTRKHGDRGGANNRDGQLPSSSGQSRHDQCQPCPAAQNAPLKHSIARLTADSETHDKSVQFHHSFLVQQECNNVPQHVSSGLRKLFENEVVVSRLDKPPLTQQKFYNLLDTKSKPNKPRKGLNDCIAMLKNKLVDPVPNVQTDHISVQCGDDDPIYPEPRSTGHTNKEPKEVAKQSKMLQSASVIQSQGLLFTTGNTNKNIQGEEFENTQANTTTETKNINRNVEEALGKRTSLRKKSAVVYTEPPKNCADILRSSSRSRRSVKSEKERKPTKSATVSDMENSQTNSPVNKSPSSSQIDSPISKSPPKRRATSKINISIEELIKTSQISVEDQSVLLNEANTSKLNEVKSSLLPPLAPTLITLDERPVQSISDAYLVKSRSEDTYSDVSHSLPGILSDAAIRQALVPQTYQSTYNEIPNIPLAHASTLALTVPLDLSGKANNMELQTAHDTMGNYNSYETLDLSSKSLELILCESDVVDLRVITQNCETSLDLSFRPEHADHITHNLETTPTDLSVKRKNASCNVADEDVVQDLSSQYRQMENLNFEMEKDFPTDLSNKNVHQHNMTANDQNIYLSHEYLEVEGTVYMDEEKLRASRSFDISNANSVYEPTLKIPQYMMVQNESLVSDEKTGSFQPLTSPPVNNTGEYPLSKSPHVSISTSLYLQDNLFHSNAQQSIIETLPAYSLPHRFVSTVGHKIDNTTPVYALSHACISVTKVDSYNNVTLTSSLLSIPSTTLDNTTSVYTLAGSSTVTPMNYGLHSTGIGMLPPSRNTIDCALNCDVNQALTSDTGIGMLPPSRNTIDCALNSDENQALTSDLLPVNRIDKELPVDLDPEVDKRIALLPKELVEILGTMPADHRKQLLKVLPQYVTVSTACPAKKESSLFPTQTISLVDDEFADENVDMPCEPNDIDINKQERCNFLKDKIDIKCPIILDKKNIVLHMDAPDENNRLQSFERQVIDLTEDETTIRNNNILKDDVEPHNSLKPVSHEISNINFTVKSTKNKTDQTSSLRAVRIKAPSERNRSVSVEIPQAALDHNPEPNVLLDTNEASKSPQSKSLAIQQAEVSSTQQSKMNQHHSKNSVLVTERKKSEDENNKSQKLVNNRAPQIIMPKIESEPLLKKTNLVSSSIKISDPTSTGSSSDGIKEQKDLNTEIVVASSVAINENVRKPVSETCSSNEKVTDFVDSLLPSSTPNLENSKTKKKGKNKNRKESLEDDSDDDVSLAAIVKKKLNESNDPGKSTVQNNEPLEELESNSDYNEPKSGIPNDNENILRNKEAKIKSVNADVNTLSFEKTKCRKLRQKKNKLVQKLHETILPSVPDKTTENDKINTDVVNNLDNLSTQGETSSKYSCKEDNNEKLKLVESHKSKDNDKDLKCEYQQVNRERQIQTDALDSSAICDQNNAESCIDTSVNSIPSIVIYDSQDSFDSTNDKPCRELEKAKNDKKIREEKTGQVNTQKIQTSIANDKPRNKQVIPNIEVNEKSSENNESVDNFNSILSSEENNTSKKVSRARKSKNNGSGKYDLTSDNLITEDILQAESSNLAIAPLRRSRRGKSVMLNNLKNENEITVHEITESRAPLTKKQLIFSKLMLDGEHKLKEVLAIEKETKQDNMVVNCIKKMHTGEVNETSLNFSDTLEAVTQVEKNETNTTNTNELGKVLSSTHKNKTVKRKKAIKSKTKSKKKKLHHSSYSAVENIICDSPVIKDLPLTVHNSDISGGLVDVAAETNKINDKEESSDTVRSELKANFTEKRKHTSTPLSIEVEQLNKSKKFKLFENESIVSDQSKHYFSKDIRSVPCYISPVLSRHTRSKSVAEKSSDIYYDPYDIDFDEIIESTEPFTRKSGKNNKFVTEDAIKAKKETPKKGNKSKNHSTCKESSEIANENVEENVQSTADCDRNAGDTEPFNKKIISTIKETDVNIQIVKSQTMFKEKKLKNKIVKKDASDECVEKTIQKNVLDLDKNEKGTEISVKKSSKSNKINSDETKKAKSQLTLTENKCKKKILSENVSLNKKIKKNIAEPSQHQNIDLHEIQDTETLNKHLNAKSKLEVESLNEPMLHANKSKIYLMDKELNEVGVNKNLEENVAESLQSCDNDLNKMTKEIESNSGNLTKANKEIDKISNKSKLQSLSKEKKAMKKVSSKEAIEKNIQNIDITMAEDTEPNTRKSKRANKLISKGANKTKLHLTLKDKSSKHNSLNDEESVVKENPETTPMEPLSDTEKAKDILYEAPNVNPLTLSRDLSVAGDTNKLKDTCADNKKKTKKVSKKSKPSTKSQNKMDDLDPMEDKNRVKSKVEIISGPKGNISDSDDSSKSDVPLKKYVENKEQKTRVAERESSVTTEITNEKLYILEEAQDKVGTVNEKKKRTLKVSNNVENVDVEKTICETDEELRSEQFMESFGFFSERKPRKSNLLAAKKISETFHLIANASDDMYFGLKDHQKAKKTQNENRKSTDEEGKVDPDVKVSKRGRKKKTESQSTPCYCDICKKEFRRPDNYLRHQMTLFHISKLSEIELKFKTVPVEEEPNYLIAYKQQLDRLKILTDKLAKRKKNSKAAAKIILPTMEEILANVDKTVREQQLSQRGLSRDEALFLDCCELLKESHKTETTNVDAITVENAILDTRNASTGLDLFKKSETDSRCDESGEVDSLTAKTILESEEVRNLENDLISGLKEAANALNSRKVHYLTSVDGERNSLDDIENYSSLSESNYDNNDCSEMTDETSSNKLDKLPERKEKMYPDVIEDIDMFEDKFDKIKRKCRSQAAAAKQTQNVVESNSRNSSRKKSEKKKGKKLSKKNQNTVLTKGALKGFDGIKVSIPTSELNVSAIVQESVKKKRKSNIKKNSDKRHFESEHEADRLNKDSVSNKKVDVYEFMDNEDAELFEFRPSTLMERFKNISSKEVPCTSKRDELREANNSSASASDGDDFVYMSDDYVGSEDETENSLMSCEFSSAKTGSEVKKLSSPIKRKDAVEKNAVMGKIFKHNAVRTDKKAIKSKDNSKLTANLDQLFDSLLEDEPNSSVLNDEPFERDNFISSNQQGLSSPSIKKLATSSPFKQKYLYDGDETMRTSKKSKKADKIHSMSKNLSSISKEDEALLKKQIHKKKSDNQNLSKKYGVKFSKMLPIKGDNFIEIETTEVITTEDEIGIDLGEDFDTSLLDDAGVARQRARRKCTVGKQNVLAETWSSESEPDGLPPRPNSAESVMIGFGRKKKGRKKEGHMSRKGNHKHLTMKKQDLDNRVNRSRLSAVSSNSNSEKSVEKQMDSSEIISAVGKGKPRPIAWSEGDDEQEHIQQHGWIVGDSHKKLVTMLAHAKGRKRNADDKRHLVE